MRRLLVLVVLAAPATAACRSRAAPADAGPAVLAPIDVGPPKAPPPLRAPHPSAPPLPDLPLLGNHEAPAAAPASMDAGDHPCRAVWTGSQVASLACARSVLFGRSREGNAEFLVPRKLLARSSDALPAVVDHRLDGTEGPVRDQTTAPACTAFAIATAVDHALARWNGRTTPVSVMEVWSRYHSPFIERSLASNVGRPLGAEQGWSFNASEATGWIACSEFPTPPRGGCDRPVNDARIKRVESSPVGEITKVEYLGVPDVAVLEATIAAGQDVVVSMELPLAFVPKGRPGARYLPHYIKSAGMDAGHALVLAGYARLGHGAYFLAHNSWGTGWGDGGYAWIHEATLEAWGRDSVAIDAEPALRDPSARPRRQRGETTCPGTLVPDSIRGTCAPLCADGGPRHDGACASPGQCRSGYVNLTGSCVLEAPKSAGADPESGIAWTCGPSGCSYLVPRRSDPSCTGSVCKASCPAPDFHLGRMRGEIVCLD